MSDNATALDAAASSVTFRTREAGGVHAAVSRLAYESDLGVEALVKPAAPLPVADGTAATALVAILSELGAKVEPADLAGLASQTTLAAILAKLSADPATETGLDAILAKLSADPATQTTLAAILAKLIAAPATEAKQDAIVAKLSADPATQTTLAAILAKLIAAPATEAKQDTGNGSLATLVASMATLVAASATEATLAALSAKVPTLGTTIPTATADAMPVRQAPVDFWRCGFAGVGAGVVTPDLVLDQTGSGMAVSQSAGNLVVTTGTTTNAETVIRSARSFRGAMLARFKLMLSQRIVNQTFRVELADRVGDGLAYAINSATSITVTFGAGLNPFTAANVGQFLRLSRITGAAGIPGRYAIASVSGDTVTFTVAAWPASGSGTLTLYGRNGIMAEYSGATATAASFDAQRDGWASGATTPTVLTTASPGHVVQMSTDVLSAAWSDGLVASNAAPRWTERADRIENIPDDDTDLWLFITVQNGSTAPASTTTLTMGYVQVERQGRQKVKVGSSDPVGAMQGLPVTVRGTVPVSGTVTANIGTGSVAAGTNAIGDVGVQYRASATGAAGIIAAMSPATPAAGTIKASAGRLVGWQLHNGSAGVRSVKLFNAASPTLGTTAAVMEIDIPAGGRSDVQLPGGIGFATAITWSATSAKGLTDNTATGLAANDVSGAFFFA
jgi:hypothetical protein